MLEFLCIDLTTYAIVYKTETEVNNQVQQPGRRSWSLANKNQQLNGEILQK